MQRKTKYKHLFFDLDRTLWDFDRNSRDALADILQHYGLLDHSLDAGSFYDTYNRINDRFWSQYRAGQIGKEFMRKERFVLALAAYGIHNEELAAKIGEDYIRLSPYKTSLIPHTVETLEYLHARYALYIITNGFDDVQFIKLNNSGLNGYFRKVFTSEQAQSNKPAREIFHLALSAVNARKEESLMIGDDMEVDILGASAFGMDQVYFNPDGRPHNEKPTFEIRNLRELQDIL